MVKLKKSKLLSTKEKEKIDDVINALEALRIEFFNNRGGKKIWSTVCCINGQPSIGNMMCTYATKEIRHEIESMFDANKNFILPDEYSYTIEPSISGGNVAKIIKKQ